jgi:hypothetical protein
MEIYTFKISSKKLTDLIGDLSKNIVLKIQVFRNDTNETILNNIKKKLTLECSNSTQDKYIHDLIYNSYWYFSCELSKDNDNWLCET